MISIRLWIDFLFPYLVAALFFFNPDLWIELLNFLAGLRGSTSWFTRTEVRIRFIRNSFIIVGAISLIVINCVITVEHAYVLFNLSNQKTFLMEEILFSTTLTGFLTFIGIVFYYFYFKCVSFLKKSNESIDIKKDRIIFDLNKFAILMRVSGVILIFSAPFVGVLLLIHA